MVPGLRRKYKDGLPMASRKLSAKDLEQIRKLAEGWGKIVARQAFGENGPGLNVDLEMMEEVAVAAAQGLTKGTLEVATQQQAAALAAEQPCPQCGASSPATENETRGIRVRGGAFEHREPVHYCRHCRRSFFPSAAAAEA